MESGGDQPTIVTVEEVEDHETLLRLTWWPEDIAPDGTLLPTAIASQDLQGPDRGLSVNRENMTCFEALRALADQLQARSPKDRIKPHVNSAVAGEVRLQKDEFGGNYFIVEHSPVPENLAHAHISSCSKRSKSQARKLRLILIELFSTAAAIEDYFHKAL
jgi:hypothetical protein